MSNNLIENVLVLIDPWVSVLGRYFCFKDKIDEVHKYVQIGSIVASPGEELRAAEPATEIEFQSLCANAAEGTRIYRVEREYLEMKERFERAINVVSSKFPSGGSKPLFELLHALPGDNLDVLAKHCRVSLETVRAESSLAAQRAAANGRSVEMPSIFLSHSSKDKFFARRLAEELRRQGVQVWVDEAEIRVGDSLTEKIAAGIENAKFFGIVLSHNSINSKWVQEELKIAIAKEIKLRQVVILPLLLEPVTIPPFLLDKKYADFTNSGKFGEALAELLGAFGLPASTNIVTTLIKEKVEPVQAPIAKPPEHRKSPSELRLEGFEDIRITGIDEKQTHRPDPSKALYNVYLTLSADPPEDWGRIFEAERQFPRHTMWRRAWIEGQSIVVLCGLDEVEKYHLDDLKQDVANSNQKFRKYLMEKIQRDQHQAAKEDKEKSVISDLKKKLKFD